MKVVLDSNVLLSGLARPDSEPGKIISAWDNHSFEVVISEFQLAELARVLKYPKVEKLLKWNEVQIQAFIRQLYLRVEVVDIALVKQEVPTDPDDSPILASLIAAKADYLVSGDGDLLAPGNLYPILSPTEFVRRL